MKHLVLAIAMVAVGTAGAVADGLRTDSAGNVLVSGIAGGAGGSTVTCIVEGPTGPVTWHARSSGVCYAEDMRGLSDGEQPSRP